MTYLAKYSVLRYFPYINREEHIFVGIVVMLPDGELRVHIAQNLRKVKVVDPAADLEAIRDMESSTPAFVAQMGWKGDEVFAQLSEWGSVRTHPNVCLFQYANSDQYRERVQSILESLVIPRRGNSAQRETVSRLFQDLKKVFSAYDWIGATPEDITKHRIVPRFPISAADGVKAEFALRNGSLHVIETVDFRTENPSSKRQEAMSKALVFDLAAKLEGQSVKSYVVTAGDKEKYAQPIVGLLRRYSGNIFSWENPEDLECFLGILEDATKKPRMTLPLG